MLHLPPLKIFMPGAGGGYIIEGSAYGDGSTGKLVWTPSGAPSSTTRRTVYIAYKPGAIGNSPRIISGYASANERFAIEHNSSGVFDFSMVTTSGRQFRYISNDVFRDYAAWYGILIDIDTSVASPTCDIYVAKEGETNGFRKITSFSTSTNSVNQNDPIPIVAQSVIQCIFAFYNGSYGSYLDGALSMVGVWDGGAALSDIQSLDGEDYVTILDTSGTTFGGNGVLLLGGTDVAAGTDSSGNGNDFTPSGTITATNDSPTDDADNGYGNLCRWNPNEPSANTYASGNQTVTLNASNEAARGTLAVNSGRYYFELHCDAIGGDGHTGAGIQKADESLDLSNSTATVGAETYIYFDDGRTINNGANASTGLTNYGASAVIGVDLNLDSNQVSFYLADSLETTETISAGTFYAPYVACHASSTNTWTLKTDPDDWTYAAKGDGVSLATQNMPAASYSSPATGTTTFNGTTDNTFIYTDGAPNPTGTITINSITQTVGTDVLCLSNGLKVISSTPNGSLAYSIPLIASDAGGALQGGSNPVTQGRARAN